MSSERELGFSVLLLPVCVPQYFAGVSEHTGQQG